MGKSSKDKRDAYYRLAKEQGWRARSAFKLLQLDEEFNLFEGVTRVVDLCAAPGSWSQVLSRVLIQGERLGRCGWEDRRYGEVLRRRGMEGGHADAREREGEGEAADGKGRKEGDGEGKGRRRNVKIVAIDLQPMSPLEGITCLKADITHPATIPLLLHALDPDTSTTAPTDAQQTTHLVDLVLSDGAPDVTGLHALDTYIQAQLLHAALNLASRILKPGGRFVAKIFRGKDVDLLFAQLRVFFARVVVAKPRSSRASSVEAFVVCEGFRLPDGWSGAGGESGSGLEGEVGEAKRAARTEKGRIVREDGITEVDFGSEDEDGGEDDNGDGARHRWIAPFLACGDLSAFDADASYKLPEGHVSLDPVQPPTAPPYRQALEERRKLGGAYGKTKLGEVR